LGLHILFLMATKNNMKTLKPFIAISILYLTFDLFKIFDITAFLKPFLLFSLLFAVSRFNFFITKKWLLTALVFSLIGDCFLIFTSKSELFFILGLISFLCSHIFYILLFSKQKTIVNRSKSKSYYFNFVFILLYLLVFLWILVPKLGDLTIPVIVYAIILSLMCAAAANGNAFWEQTGKQNVMFGALFFVISDSILAFDKFYAPIPMGSFLIMLTYILAQYFIVKGILIMNKDKS
jgi:uncharacterized membrane protein YhhN